MYSYILYCGLSMTSPSNLRVSGGGFQNVCSETQLTKNMNGQSKLVMNNRKNNFTFTDLGAKRSHNLLHGKFNFV